jgi:hypothetical protein
MTIAPTRCRQRTLTVVTWLRLYPDALGGGWSTLPEPLRACHDPCPSLEAEGRFTVTRSRSWLARMILFMAQMPPDGDDVALRLGVRAHPDHQIWERDFDGFRMTTVQALLPDGRMAERKGAIELLFRVTVDGDAVVYSPAGVRLCAFGLRIPFPSWLGPRVEARAWCEPGEPTMNVRVSMSVPVVGALVTYGGPLAIRKLGEAAGLPPQSA